MKKLLYVIAVFAATSIFFSSCDFIKHGWGGGEDDSLQTDSSLHSLHFCIASYQDTLRFGADSISDQAFVEQDMEVEFPEPEATGVLADSIRAWLVREVRSSYRPNWGEHDDGITMNQIATYQPGNEQEFVEAYARAGVKEMSADAQKGIEEGYFASQSNGYKASVSVIADRYVTYETSYYLFTGGAHGSSLAGGITFRRSDGRAMGWHLIDPAKYAVFIGHVKDELRRYFDVDHMGKQPLSDEALMEELQLWDNPETPENELKYGLPLPTTAPYIVRNGIAFVYQQYEIAAYAYGLPSGVIPFDVVKDCLSPEGLELCELEP